MMLSARQVAAHPRVSGENDVSQRMRDTGTGSSPRERGKLGRPGGINAITRLIPA